MIEFDDLCGPDLAKSGGVAVVQFLMLSIRRSLTALERGTAAIVGARFLIALLFASGGIDCSKTRN
jgi:hypothetical protein